MLGLSVAYDHFFHNILQRAIYEAIFCEKTFPRPLIMKFKNNQ